MGCLALSICTLKKGYCCATSVSGGNTNQPKGSVCKIVSENMCVCVGVVWRSDPAPTDRHKIRLSHKCHLCCSSCF